MSKAYRQVTEEEKDCAYEYDVAVGPAGFECMLTEPEDRTFYRDARTCLIRLNELHELLVDALTHLHGTELEEKVRKITGEKYSE